MFRVFLIVALVFANWPDLAAAIDLSPEERERVFQHGRKLVDERDPTNRLSDVPAAVELGRRLFFDPRLSRNGQVACSTCHDPNRQFSDDKLHVPFPGGEARRTPSITYSCRGRWFFWDGRADTLWSQALHPISEAGEMGLGEAGIYSLISKDEGLLLCYRQIPGVDTLQSNPTLTQMREVYVNVAKSIAAFECTLPRYQSPFDEYVESLRSGHEVSATSISASAIRGLKVFVRDGSCRTCHSGPDFTNGEFHNIGIAEANLSGNSAGGRYSGIDILTQSEFRADGFHSDSKNSLRAKRTQKLIITQGLRGAFKTPSLRNVELREPFMHNGSKRNLDEVLEHYRSIKPSSHPHSERVLQINSFTKQEAADLVAFIKSLSDSPKSYVAKSNNEVCR